jgi:hypothetical protein
MPPFALICRALLVANLDLDYDKMIHQHPLLGGQNIPKLIHFIRFHERLHQEQMVHNVLAHPQFPKTA